MAWWQLLLAVVAGLPLAITLVEDVIGRWRLRHIPAPWTPLLIGSSLELLFFRVIATTRRLARCLGPVHQLRIGSAAVVMLSDPEAARSLFYKFVNHSTYNYGTVALLRGELAQIHHAGLIFARDDFWRLVRMVWQPAFSPGSLDNYARMMNDSAQRLVDRLRLPSVTGEVVDMCELLSLMGLEVVGSTAYGLKLNVLGTSGPAGDTDARQAKIEAMAAQLVQAEHDLMETLSPEIPSIYMVHLILWCRRLYPLLRFLANLWPDRNLKKAIDARTTIRDICKALIDDWRDREKEGSLHRDEALLAAPAGQAAMAVEGDVRAKPRPAVAPGSFLGLLLSARDKGTGESLTDLQMIAQVSTFLTAGYETTSNTMTFMLYLLAQNPKAEARAAQEARSFGTGRVFTPDDIEKLPYLFACMQETLRLIPTIHSTGRTVDKPLNLCGYDIPLGTEVAVNMHIMHRDPAIWPRPDDFLPERWLQGPESDGLTPTTPLAYAPFGGGTRMCIGFRFAQQETMTTMVHLLQEYRFELMPGQVPLRMAESITTAPKNGVMMRVHVRSSA